MPQTLSSLAVSANPEPSTRLRLVLADPMDGVRDAWRWLLAAWPGIDVAAEAGSVAGALASPGDVVLAGLRFPDGTAADLIAAGRPVVVWTFLPPDERTEVDLTGAATVLGAGTLRDRLGSALLQAVGERSG